MADITLIKKDCTAPKNLDVKNPRNITNADVLMEARNMHNELVDAILKINEKLGEISEKIEKHAGFEAAINFNAESITDLQKVTLPALRREVDSNLKKVDAALTVKLDNHEDKIVAQEGHSRRRNIIINGKPDVIGENIKEVVHKFLVDDLHIDEGEVQNYLFRDMHRLPKAKNKDGTEKNLPRPIIVAFLRQGDRNAVMRRASELKGTDISIKSDLPHALNTIRGKMLEERHRLKGIEPTVKYRVAEISYRPVLQRADGKINGTERIKWVNVKFPAEQT